MPSLAAKPPELFDRDWEWAELVGFATDPRPGPTLGIVSGRRRQGKSYLLSALVGALGGMYHEAVEGERLDVLRRLATSYAAAAGQPIPPQADDADALVSALVGLGDGQPYLVVLDELPYIAAAEPSFTSLVQRALGPQARRAQASAARVLLCGSALSVMGGLLKGDAPLRGRAGLELLVQSFDYREAAQFWGLADDPRAALAVHAIVGGTPAYRREFVGGDAPSGHGDVDSWVVRTVLNPARPLLREGRVLLAEEAVLRDRALYHSVLASISSGDRTRGRIASRVGRPSDALGHALTVLQHAGLVERREDAFRRGRPSFVVAEPILRFWHAVVRPHAGDLTRPADAARVWRARRHTFESAILRPAFEDICRTWVRRYAAPELTGGLVTGVSAGVLSDPRRDRHKVDLVAHVHQPGHADSIGLLGEAKVGRPMGLGDLDRLERARAAATAAGHDARDARLVLFGGAGFSDDLQQRGRRHEVTLVDLERVYSGT